MANRQSRDVGEQLQTSIAGRVFTDVPAFAVDDSAGFTALKNVGAQLGLRLHEMAEEAAATAGTLVGLTTVQRNSAGYLARQQVNAAAVARSAKLSPDIDAAILRAAELHGEDPDTLRLIARLESSGDPLAQNKSSSAGGLFQFIDGTAKAYGLQNRFDPEQAADAAARLTRDNRDVLSKALGRDPSAAELYLAHQQGAAGASKLLTNPDARAADLVGLDAVTLNAGRADMTAREFAQLWLGKAGAAPSGKALETRAEGELDATPLALRRDGTVFGDAFDDAAIRATSWRMQSKLTADLGQAFEENKDDPQAFEDALGQIYADAISDSNLADPLLLEVFEEQFARKTQAYRMKVANLFEQRLRQEEIVAAQDGMADVEADLERQAFALGATVEADEILTPQIDRAALAIDNAAASGLISPADAAKRKDDLAYTVLNARTEAVFESLPTPTEKQSFALQILDDYATGKGPYAELSLSQAQAISENLYGRAAVAQERAQAAGKVEVARINTLLDDDVASIKATGTGIDMLEAGLNIEEAGLLLGGDAIGEWQQKRRLARRNWEATVGMESQTAVEIAERLTLLQPEEGQAGFIEQSGVYAQAVLRAQAVRDERQTDPLGQAMRAGAVEIEGIDASSIDALGQSLTLRAQAAEQVAGLYDAPFAAFLPGEAEALGSALTVQPELLPGFAAQVVSAFGNRAPAALAQLSESGGSALAHTAALSLSTGDNSVAEDIAQTLSLRQQGVYKMNMPEGSKSALAVATYVQGAFEGQEPVQAAVGDVAMLLFEGAANRMGFDPKEIDKPGSPAHVAFQTAIDRAVGKRVVRGVQYGGFINVNGRNTFVPPALRADLLPDAFGSLTEADLDAQPPLADGLNGLPLPVNQIKRGQLIAIAEGVYAVMLGDNRAFDPRFVRDADGQKWELSLDALLESQRARQAAQLERLQGVNAPLDDRPEELLELVRSLGGEVER